MTILQPLIVGSGGASRALRLALSMYPEEIRPPRQLGRGEPLPEVEDGSLLVIANPHGLHTPLLLEAAQRGYRWAICEKPAAVSLEQLDQLDGLSVATWICHGYRRMWGPEFLRRAWVDGELGEVFSVEGRYWQAGAVRDLAEVGLKPAKSSWKDDPALGGLQDVVLDLGTHWVDLMIYLTGTAPTKTQVRLWYANAASAHRDTHVQVHMEHGSTTSFGSISKAVHGAGNHLEIHLLGSRATASWRFADPDVVVWGQGRQRTTRVRTEAQPPARLSPHHGLGWIEGYASLVGDVVQHVCHGQPRRGPSLEEHSVALRALLTATASRRAAPQTL